MKRCRISENSDDRKVNDGTEIKPETYAGQHSREKEQSLKFQCDGGEVGDGYGSFGDSGHKAIVVEGEDVGENDPTILEDDEEADLETDTEEAEEDEEDPETDAIYDYEEEDMDLSSYDGDEENDGAEAESAGTNVLKFVEGVGDTDEVDVGEDKEVNSQERNLVAEQICRAIAQMICFQKVPLFVIKKLILIMNRHFQYLTEDADLVKSECLKLYEEEKVKIKHLLNKAGSISVSVDIFTDYKPSGYSDDFLCLTAHFMDEDWNLKKWVLCFQSHNTADSDFIDDAILKSMKDWNIEHNVSNLTSRRAYCCFTSVSEEFICEMKAHIEKKRKLPLDSSLFSVRCIAEMFSLMAQDAFGEADKIIRKLEILHWSKSLPMWHTTNHKLKEALDMQSLGEFDSDDVREDCDVPSPDEWDRIRIVHRLVDSTHKVAKLVFEAECPIAYKLLHNLLELCAELVQESKSGDSFSSTVAKKMLKRLDKYLKKTFLLLSIASVLDPCCKMQQIEYTCSKFEDTNGNFQSSTVLEAIRKLHGDYIEKECVEGASSSKLGLEADASDKKSDLDMYLEDPVCPSSDDFNLLQWWKSEGHKYPTVAKMARDILAVPFSVATSYDALIIIWKIGLPIQNFSLQGPNWRMYLRAVRAGHQEPFLKLMIDAFLWVYSDLSNDANIPVIPFEDPNS